MQKTVVNFDTYVCVASSIQRESYWSKKRSFFCQRIFSFFTLPVAPYLLIKVIIGGKKATTTHGPKKSLISSPRSDDGDKKAPAYFFAMRYLLSACLYFSLRPSLDSLEKGESICIPRPKWLLSLANPAWQKGIGDLGWQHTNYVSNPRDGWGLHFTFAKKIRTKESTQLLSPVWVLGGFQRADQVLISRFWGVRSLLSSRGIRNVIVFREFIGEKDLQRGGEEIFRVVLNQCALSLLGDLFGWCDAYDHQGGFCAPWRQEKNLRLWGENVRKNGRNMENVHILPSFPDWAMTIYRNRYLWVSEAKHADHKDANRHENIYRKWREQQLEKKNFRLRFRFGCLSRKWLFFRQFF